MAERRFLMLGTRRPTSICCVLGIVLLYSLESQAEELTPLQSFEVEAPVAWSKLIELGSCVECECSARKTDRISGKVVYQVGPLPFRGNGLLGRGPLSADATTRIECQNLDYEFVVDQVAPKQWEVKQLIWKDRKGQKFENQPYYHTKDGTVGSLPWQRVLAVACRGLIIHNMWLPYLASLPTFKVIEATEVADEAGGGHLIRVKFANQAKRRLGLNIESGEIILDPERFWQIVAGHINTHQGHEGPNQYDIVLDVKNEFDMADNRFPYVRRQTETLVSLPVLHTVDVCETKVALADRRDVSPFRLPAFGIPEPSPEPPKAK